MEFLEYPKTPQFRQVIKELDKVVPTTIGKRVLKFKGSVKLHGTHAGVMWNEVDGIWCQSRNKIIKVGEDNFGFAQFISERPEAIQAIIDRINGICKMDAIAIFGEWCGGSIQSGVAIAGLERFYVIFAVRVMLQGAWYCYDFTVEGEDLPKPDPRIRYSNEFPTYEIDIDLDNPMASVNELVRLTEEVEAECPVGKAYGVSGYGEGIVWRTCISFQGYLFKVKGEKHTSSNVKVLASVDPELVKSIDEFILYACTENRLGQALVEAVINEDKEVTMQNISPFLQWLYKDIITEEADTLEASGLVAKDISKRLSTYAKAWYLRKCV